MKTKLMKKILFTMLILGASVAFTSCAKDDECVCDNGVTLTEEDAKDDGVTLSEACDFAETGGATCNIE